MTYAEELMKLARRGPFRAADVTAAGIPRVYLKRWSEKGLVHKVGRGLYRLAADEPTELATIAEVGARAPGANICLLSALEIHGLTSESPPAVWLMIRGKSRAPRIDFVHIEVIRATGPAFEFGVMHQQIEGVPVRITSPAKTVADCFRYRRHVGLDVALEALRGYVAAVHARRGADYSMRKLQDAIQASRVSSVVRPYLEALA